tara:strand:+ start:7479 stop:8228 length:750 start_codon:yes stop_codon:yes gene_type:complete
VKLTYTQDKRIKSLSKRYFSDFNSLEECKDINDHYHSNFIIFVEALLVEHCGYKKEEPKPEFYRPRKVGSRPKKRKPGERPPRIGEQISKTEKCSLVKSEIENNIAPTGFSKPSNGRPDWEKKAWRQIMMNVHPDRLDSVSKDEMDKLQRMQIGDLIRQNDTPEFLVCCSHLLDLSPELSVHEQERLLRVSINKINEEKKVIHNSVPWLWGESFVDNNLRLQVVKSVLANNNITLPSDHDLLSFIAKNN